MADVVVTNPTCSAITDQGVAGEIGPAEWNAASTFSGGVSGQVSVRDTGSATGASWWTPTVKPVTPLTPVAANLPSAAMPARSTITGTNWAYDVLDYDAAASESASWHVRVPAGFTPVTANLELYWLSQWSTEGTVAWTATFRPVPTGGPACWDGAGVTAAVAALAASSAGFILRQQVTSGHVPCSSGWAAQDMVQVKVARDVASDNLGTDARFLLAVLSMASST